MAKAAGNGRPGPITGEHPEFGQTSPRDEDRTDGGQSQQAPGEDYAEDVAEDRDDEAKGTDEAESTDEAEEEAVEGEDLSEEEQEEEAREAELEEVPVMTTVEMVIPEDEPPAEPAPQSGAGFWPWLVLGLVAGCAAGALLYRLFARLGKRRSGRAAHLEGVVAQGLGTRENQQDALFLSDPRLYREQGVLLCVADGMGGLSNGQIISSTAVSTIASTFASSKQLDPERLLITLVQNANQAVNHLVSPNYGSGGTTLLLGLIRKGMFYFTAVGDSRICLCRDGELIHLNRPHVFEDELILSHINGEMSYERAKTYEKKEALTSYLGMGKLKYLDVPDYAIPIRKGDRFILMSDGVFGALSDEELLAILRLRSGAIPEALTGAIEGKRRKYQDNYSAVIVTVK